MQREREEIASTRAGAAAVPSFGGGRYVVRRLLGEGGQKTVFLAHDTQLDRDVAIAVLKIEGLDAQGIARVQREAQAMARLGAQAHIVTIFDIGEHEGRPFMVCEYMGGGDLHQALRGAGGALPAERALRVGRDLCRALAVAHNRGILHRDIKPANVWLTEEGSAKLGDFGLAISLGQSRVTQAGTVLGTAAYMAPEQALGADADQRADLYSLGCVLYEMVTGRPPFLGDDTIAVVTQHINTSPVAPSWHQQSIPQALERLILRLLSKAPEERPSDAAEVLAALETISEVQPEAAPREDANPLDRLAGGIFVGREDELAELRSAIDQGLTDRGRLILLAGEPGIGKTRLAEELATYARLRSAQVVWGRCYEGEGAPAYWPWVQAIRSYVYERSPEALLSELGTGAGDIAQIVSEVRERLPGLPPPPALEPEQARFRLFDSVTTFLKNASRGQPLVLLLDDLHWADKPSLLLLQFLARELRETRLVVLGTYRDVELGRQHPLSHTLAELTREQLSHRIVLHGLSEHDVARFIEMTAGEEPPPDLVATVYQETEGNPFFVKEIVNLLTSEGRLGRKDPSTTWTVVIPQSVREVVGRRLDQLSDECNRLLTIAAVAGREFSIDVLQGVSGMEEDPLLDALEEAVAARVVAELPRPAGTYRFSHALIRETLYEELTTARRVRLHRQIGDALEQLYGSKADAHLAELAHHFGEAALGGGDVTKAIEYARRAGERATAVYAYEEAAGHFERVLQLLELDDSAGETERCEGLLALAEAEWAAGNYGKSRDLYYQAGTAARENSEGEQLARAALGYGGETPGFGVGVQDDQVIDLLESALALLGDERSATRLKILARLASALTYSHGQERRIELCHTAIQAARELGNPRVLAFVLIHANWALWSPDNVAERLAMVEEARRITEALGAAQLLHEATIWHTAVLIEVGDMDQIVRNIQTISGPVEQQQQRYEMWVLQVIRATLAMHEGNFAEARRLAEHALSYGQSQENPNALQLYALQMGAMRFDIGGLDEILPAIRQFSTQFAAIPAWRCGLVAACSELGLEPEARAEFERLAAEGFDAFPRDMFWSTGMYLLSMACLFLKDAERAQLLYDLLLPSGGLCIAPFAASFGSAWLPLAMLAQTMGHWDDAIRHFDQALEANTKFKAKVALTRTRAGYAAALVARGAPGDRERAQELATQALQAAEAMGMKVIVERCLALKLKLQGADGRDTGNSIAAVSKTVLAERPDVSLYTAPDGTVTILFTDIEGSTALNERLGDERWMALLRQHNAIVTEHVAAHEGTIVKAIGDGFMVVFRNVRRGLECAIAIQRALADRVARGDEQPPVRIGLHTGAAVKEADDFYGLTVNLAGRIADAANGGEILVSSVLRDLVDGAHEFRFDAARELELKGLAGRHIAYAVRW